jgi:hypothetical protein
MKSKRILCAGLASLLAGCLATTGTATGPAARVMSVAPAGSDGAARLREVAVLPFDGPSGREFAQEIEAMLASVVIGGKPYFRVADRQRLDATLREIKFSQSGVVNNQQALRLGKLLGVRALYAGGVNAPATHTSYMQEARMACAEHDSKKTFLGVPRCKRWTENKVSCQKTEVTYSFTPKLIEAETGLIVYSESIQGMAAAAWCPDSAAPAPTQARLLAQAKASAMLQFRRQVAPSASKLDVQLMHSTDGVASEPARRKLAQGIEFAVAQRMDRACELWQEADSAAPRAVPILYNLAICAETSGEMERAAVLYRQVDRLLDRPDDRVSAALARMEKARTDKARLNRQAID